MAVVKAERYADIAPLLKNIFKNKTDAIKLAFYAFKYVSHVWDKSIDKLKTTKAYYEDGTACKIPIGIVGIHYTPPYAILDLANAYIKEGATTYARGIIEAKAKGLATPNEEVSRDVVIPEIPLRHISLAGKDLATAIAEKEEERYKMFAVWCIIRSLKIANGWDCKVTKISAIPHWDAVLTQFFNN